MQTVVIDRLVELNNTFYQTFGKAFAITRKRIQPGIARCLAEFNSDGKWLDLGCGGGTIAEAWAYTPGRKGSYLGIDFSAVLLGEARNLIDDVKNEDVRIDFLQGDLASDEFWHRLDEQKQPDSAASNIVYDVITAFAVIHHIPDFDTRQKITRQIYNHLNSGGLFILSVWQLQNSSKLMSRLLPWETVGLSSDLVEKGDVLMDWRFSLPDQPEQIGFRYVHLFSTDELCMLAESTGFNVVRTFESDGEGNRLGLYEIWEKVS